MALDQGGTDPKPHLWRTRARAAVEKEERGVFSWKVISFVAYLGAAIPYIGLAAATAIFSATAALRIASAQWRSTRVAGERAVVNQRYRNLNLQTGLAGLSLFAIEVVLGHLANARWLLLPLHLAYVLIVAVLSSTRAEHRKALGIPIIPAAFEKFVVEVDLQFPNPTLTKLLKDRFTAGATVNGVVLIVLIFSLGSAVATPVPIDLHPGAIIGTVISAMDDDASVDDDEDRAETPTSQPIPTPTATTIVVPTATPLPLPTATALPIALAPERTFTG